MVMILAIACATAITLVATFLWMVGSQGGSLWPAMLVSLVGGLMWFAVGVGIERRRQIRMSRGVKHLIILALAASLLAGVIPAETAAAETATDQYDAVQRERLLLRIVITQAVALQTEHNRTCRPRDPHKTVEARALYNRLVDDLNQLTAAQDARLAKGQRGITPKTAQELRQKIPKKIRSCP